MTQKLSIAILGTRGIPAAYGGFETFAQELSIRLVQKGFDVTVYCEKIEENQTDEFKGIKLIYISSPSLGPLSTLVFDFFCLWHARKAFNLVYMLGYPPAFECFIPRLFGTPVWINMDGIEWYRSKWNLAGRTWMRMNEYLATLTANHLIADAQGIKDHLLRRHKKMPPCSVIPYGAPVLEEADCTLLKEFDVEAEGYYILVARLEPENHILEILEGYKDSISSFPLIVIGNISPSTPYIERLKSISDPRIRMIGGVYVEAKLQSLRFFSKAYFHGHSVGGTNPSLIEAMGCGNMIIAHDNVFNKEVLGNSGFYFSRADDIPNLISTLESKPHDIKKYSDAVRNRVETIYNWDIVSDQYIELIKTELNIFNETDAESKNENHNHYSG